MGKKKPPFGGFFVVISKWVLGQTSFYKMVNQEIRKRGKNNGYAGGKSIQSGAQIYNRV
ncbi:hypothetical protein [Acetobacter pasteurianus]|uniref:hypothetical protein n=1 Tax=Acetobacter pasteurianus TaxID=438 RepID=UPI003D12AB72